MVITTPIFSSPKVEEARACIRQFYDSQTYVKELTNRNDGVEITGYFHKIGIFSLTMPIQHIEHGVELFKQMLGSTATFQFLLLAICPDLHLWIHGTKQQPTRYHLGKLIRVM
jgi:hypothetical protein